MSGAKNYEAALDYATRLVAEWIATDRLLKDRHGPEDTFLWWLCAVSQSTTEDGRVFWDAHPVWLDHLAVKAWSSVPARALLVRIVSSKLLIGVPLSMAEGQFTGLLLTESFPALPKKRGRSREENWERNIFAVYLVSDVRSRFRLKPTRNEAPKKGVHRSASDAVSEAFIRNGRHEVTFTTLTNLVGDKSLRKVLKVLGRVIEERRTPAPANALRRLEP